MLRRARALPAHAKFPIRIAFGSSLIRSSEPQWDAAPDVHRASSRRSAPKINPAALPIRRAQWRLPVLRCGNAYSAPRLRGCSMRTRDLLNMEPRAANIKFYGRCALAAELMLTLVGWGSPRAQAQVPDPPALEGLRSAASETNLAPDDSAIKPEYEAATRPDQIGRIVVPVMVNGNGPFLFVLDTGATSTVLTPQLVATLGLQSAYDGGVTMNGATGSAVVSTVICRAGCGG